MQKRTREEVWVLRRKIAKYIGEGHTYLWTATKLGLRSEALARYHYQQFQRSQPPIGLDEGAPDWVGREDENAKSKK